MFAAAFAGFGLAGQRFFQSRVEFRQSKAGQEAETAEEARKAVEPYVKLLSAGD